VRALLLYLAGQEGFKNFALKFKLFHDTAMRFVAGESLEDAVRAVRQTNLQGLSGTLDLLGENTLTPEDADNARREVLEVIDRVRAERVNCNISVKLTQLGLDLDPELAFQNLMGIAKHARDAGNFVRVDMESSRYTGITLDIVMRAHAELGNVGTVIQSCLYRSERDTVDLVKRGIRVRLVKGAYLEPESVAFRKKKETDANFSKLMRILLASETYNAIATHDESLISEAMEFARSRGISKDRFEFQMLFGIRRELQLRLAQEGYNVRVYIPYGKRWYPYFMRRLAERPANVAFILRNLFKK